MAGTSLAMSARLSASVMEPTSTSAAVTAPVGTTEGAAGGWWSATAAAARAAASATQTSRGGHDGGGTRNARWGEEGDPRGWERGEEREALRLVLDARPRAGLPRGRDEDGVDGRDEDGVDGRLDVVAVHGAPLGRGRVGVGDDDEVGLRLRQGLGRHHVRLGGQDSLLHSTWNEHRTRDGGVMTHDAQTRTQPLST